MAERNRHELKDDVTRKCHPRVLFNYTSFRAPLWRNKNIFLNFFHHLK